MSSQDLQNCLNLSAAGSSTEQCDNFMREYCSHKTGSKPNSVCGCLGSYITAGQPQCMYNNCRNNPNAYETYSMRHSGPCPSTVNCEQIMEIKSRSLVAHQLHQANNCGIHGRQKKPTQPTTQPTTPTKDDKGFIEEEEKKLEMKHTTMSKIELFIIEHWVIFVIGFILLIIIIIVLVT